MNISVSIFGCKLYLYFFKDLIFFFLLIDLRERDGERERNEGQKEKERSIVVPLIQAFIG